jgi:hypothetical protein
MVSTVAQLPDAVRKSCQGITVGQCSNRTRRVIPADENPRDGPLIVPDRPVDEVNVSNGVFASQPDRHGLDGERLAGAAGTAHAGSARDYLNAPVDSWLLNYNAGYASSLTPEDGADLVPGVRANVLAQSVVLTRIMDYWGRTGGWSCLMRSSTPALGRSEPPRMAFPMSASFGR